MYYFIFQGTRQALERHTEESSQQHLALVSALATRQARQLESLRAAVARLSVNYTGALVWRISDWAAKMAEAKCKDGVELVSPAFYTSQYGYKLQVSLIIINIARYYFSIKIFLTLISLDSKITVIIMRWIRLEGPKIVFIFCKWKTNCFEW